MHIDGGDSLQKHFDDPAVFKAYRLPEDGKFQTGAYPSLLFDDRSDDIRFGGFTNDWWKVLEFAEERHINWGRQR